MRKELWSDLVQAAVAVLLILSVPDARGSPDGWLAYISWSNHCGSIWALDDSAVQARLLLREKGEGNYFISLRPTSSGTVLAAGTRGVLELDRSGKILFELPCHKIDPALARVTCAERLPNGNYLACGERRLDENAAEDATREQEPAGRRWAGCRWERDRLEILAMEVTPDGKILKNIPLGKAVSDLCRDTDGKVVASCREGAYCNSLRVLGKDGFSMALNGKALEMDWNGKVLFTLPDRTSCADALKADGRYLVCGLQWEKDKTTKGFILLCEADGREVRSWDHPCPAGVQLLPDGGVLISGG